jgi:catechol 2,3-dioxygenase-like lactoylglutathione lyase family enzyme
LKVRRLDHLVLRVKDPEATSRFYDPDGNLIEVSAYEDGAQ